MKINKLFYFLVFLFFSLDTFAIENLQVPYVQFLPDGAGGTREQKSRLVSEKVTFDLVKEVIGEKAFLQQKSNIRSKILDKKNRFILSTVFDDKASVAHVKVSSESLKSLLLKEGFLYQSSGSPVLIPVLVFENKINDERFAWWQGGIHESSQGFLSQLSRSFNSQLKDSFREKGFYVLPTSRFRSKRALPKDLQTHSLSLNSSLRVAKIWGANMVLRGSVVLLKGRDSSSHPYLKVNLQAVQTKNSRVIAEVVRVFKGKTGYGNGVMADYVSSYKEQVASQLAKQVVRSWKKGVFGSNLVRVVLKGNYEYSDLQEFKNQARKKVKGLNTITERLFGQGQVQYDVNTKLTLQELAQRLGAVQWSRKKLKIINVNAQRLALEIVKL